MLSELIWILGLIVLFITSFCQYLHSFLFSAFNKFVYIAVNCVYIEVHIKLRIEFLYYRTFLLFFSFQSSKHLRFLNHITWTLSDSYIFKMNRYHLQDIINLYFDIIILGFENIRTLINFSLFWSKIIHYSW